VHIHGEQDTPPPPHELRRNSLGTEIKGQANVLSRRRGAISDLAKTPPPSVHLHGLLARFPPKPFLVETFDSGLPDLISTEVPLLTSLLQFFSGDFSHVPRDMCREGTRRIDTTPYWKGEKLRNKLRIGHEIRYLGQSEIAHERHGPKGGPKLSFTRSGQILFGKRNAMSLKERGNPSKHPLFGEVQGISFYVEGPDILREGETVCVIDHPPRRRNANEPQPIVRGKLDIAIRLGDLKRIKPSHQKNQTHHHENSPDEKAKIHGSALRGHGTALLSGKTRESQEE
jgi:hypothetical protein